MNTGNFPLPDIQCRLHREDGLNPEHQKAGAPKDSGRESSFFRFRLNARNRRRPILRGF